MMNKETYEDVIKQSPKVKMLIDEYCKTFKVSIENIDLEHLFKWYITKKFGGA